MDYIINSNYDFPNIQNFEFFGKKARERRKGRKERKEARHVRRESRREARTQRQLNGEGFFQKIGGAASNFLNNFGNGEGASEEMNLAAPLDYAPLETHGPENNNQLYIIIGIVAIVVLFFMFKDKF